MHFVMQMLPWTQFKMKYVHFLLIVSNIVQSTIVSRAFLQYTAEMQQETFLKLIELTESEAAVSKYALKIFDIQ